MPTEPSEAEPPKRKLRWFQFSLRSLMVFNLICAVVAGWLGKKVERKRNERAVKGIVRLSGSVV